MSNLTQFRWRPLIVKVMTILVTAGAGGLTAESIRDAITSAGKDLSMDEAILLTWLFTTLFPAAWVGLRNRLKHWPWWQAHKPSWLPFLALLFLPMILIGGMCTTTTTTTVDGVVVVDSPNPEAMRVAAETLLQTTQVAFNQWFAYRAQQGSLDTAEAERERLEFERRMQYLNELIDRYAALEAARKEKTQ